MNVTQYILGGDLINSQKQFGNVSNAKVDELLKIASSKLGQDPATLKENLSRGDLAGVTKNLNQSQKTKLQGLISDPNALNQFLSDPKIKAMLQGLMKNKG